MEDWERLQREAKRRVQERELHMRRVAQGQPWSPPAPPTPKPAPKPPPPKSGGLGGLKGLSLFEDNEQLLLLFLALLLVKSEAPTELVLALLYIAL